MQFIIAAILLGFLGSFHCIGMCGPIAFALPVHNKPALEKNTSILAYNSGRMFTYATLGFIFGLLGQSFALFGYQQRLSILMGVLILLAVALPKSLFERSGLPSRFFGIFNQLKSILARQFHKRGIRSFFTVGLLNGLLPCGLVYMALAGAIATGSMWKGAAFMAAFGAGTLPFMFAISFSSHLFGTKTRSGIRKAMPFMIGAMALLLILRGSNLGIPYISPKLNEPKIAETNSCKQELKCCHKK